MTPSKQNGLFQKNFTLMNIGAKIPPKMLAKQTHPCVKGLRTTTKRDLSWECKVGQSRKVKNVTHHVNRMKHKNPIIISIGAEKVFDKVYYSFIIKILKSIKGNFLT